MLHLYPPLLDMHSTVQVDALKASLEASQNELRTLRGLLETSQEKLLCAVCEDGPVTVALIPCGHTACQKCVERLTARPNGHSETDSELLGVGPLGAYAMGTSLGECHTCRRPFLGVLRIFFGIGT